MALRRVIHATVGLTNPSCKNHIGDTAQVALVTCAFFIKKIAVLEIKKYIFIVGVDFLY